MWNSMADVTVNICFLYWLPVFHISSENSQGDKWDSIYTGMKDAIIGTLLSMQDIVECRKVSPTKLPSSLHYHRLPGYFTGCWPILFAAEPRGLPSTPNHHE
eukprot:scpid104439/ scgid3821/ 